MNKNKFPEEARLIFQDIWMCWYCGENTADSLHHIMGKKNDYDWSIFNAAPLCNEKCHLKHHGLLSTDEWRKKLLMQTANYLESIDYELKKIDVDFVDKYEKYYK